MAVSYRAYPECGNCAVKAWIRKIVEQGREKYGRMGLGGEISIRTSISADSLCGGHSCYLSGTRKTYSEHELAGTRRPSFEDLESEAERTIKEP